MRWTLPRFARAACLAAAVTSCADNADTTRGADAGEGPTACTADEVEATDGGCALVGIPPTSCAQGFVADGAEGCTPVLPTAPCAKGLMAVPGETTCREVAPCGAAPWGDIPVEASTEYVDRAFTGTSDGTAAKPWTTIQAAADAAAAGAIVAIAAGSYAENVSVQGKAVRLWGRCPGLVEIAGVATDGAAIVVTVGADGTEIHDLAVRGAHMGIDVSSASGVVADRVWVHDTVDRGLNSSDFDAAAGFKLTRSLVEATHELGVVVGAAEGTIEATVVRGTAPIAAPTPYAYGIGVIDDPMTSTRGRLVLRSSLIEHNTRGSTNPCAEVFVDGSDATIESVVIRGEGADTSEPNYGRGLAVQSHAPGAPRGSATIRSSFIEGARESGLFFSASDVSVETTVVRDTESYVSPMYGPIYGRAVSIQYVDTTGERAQVTFDSCVFERNREIGIFVGQSDATIRRTIVRDTMAQPSDGTYGDGIAVLSNGGDANAVVTESLVTGSKRAGISVFGGSAAVGASRIECNAINLDGEVAAGRGYIFQDLGNNACSCDAKAEPCTIASSGLMAPSPLP